MQTYLNLCTLYYQADKSLTPHDEFEFYYAYAQAAPGLVLEPMCGTGNFLLPFYRAGIHIEGFDASAYMLAQLHKNAQQMALEPHTWQSLLQNFSVNKRYSLIFISRSSFNLIVEDTDVEESLQRIYAHLHKGGMFIFEIMTSAALPEQFYVWNTQDPHVFMSPEGELTIALQVYDLPPQNNVGTTIARYALIKHGQLVDVEIEEYKLRVYTQEEMLLLLKKAGFSQVNCFGSYTKTASQAEDKVIIFECKK